MSVVHTLAWGKDEEGAASWRFDDVKRAMSRRTITLSPTVATALDRHRREQREARMRCADTWVDSGFLFCDRNGAPLHERNVLRAFRILVTHAGIALGKPAIRLYDLRHTAATLALSQGVSPKLVAEMLGHASAAFTLDTYSHVLPNLQAAAAQQIEELLFQ